MCSNWDILDDEKVSISKFSLSNGADAKQYYNSITTRSRGTRASVAWRQMVEKFKNSYASSTKRMELGNRLKAIGINDAREDDEGDYAALEKLIERISQLKPMAIPKDHEDEAKVRFLT